MWMPSPTSGAQRTGLAPVCSSFMRNLRLAWWSLFIQPRRGGILRCFSSEVAAGYTKIGLLVDAPNTVCLLPWSVIRTVVLPILPGGPFYVCKVVLLFVGKQPLIPVRRVVPSSPDLVVRGTTELRHDGVLGSSTSAFRPSRYFVCTRFSIIDLVPLMNLQAPLEPLHLFHLGRDPGLAVFAGQLVYVLVGNALAHLELDHPLLRKALIF
jgi:hypothetical protein